MPDSKSQLPSEKSNTWLIGCELLLIFFIVIGRVADIIPNNLVIFTLFLLVLISFLIRRVNLKYIGLNLPKYFSYVVILGIAIGIADQFFSLFVEEPLLKWFIEESPDLSQLNSLKGNFPLLIVVLIISWITAAFGEELVFRAYLLRRIAELFGETKTAYIVGLILSAIAFGAIHQYQGQAGMITAVFSGLKFGGLYLLMGRNLWLSVFAHGTLNTVGLVFLYLDWFTNQ